MNNAKRDYINVQSIQEPKIGVLFVDFVNDIVNIKKKRRSASFVSNYKTVLNLVNEFCSLSDSILYTNSINEDFLEDFVAYLEYKDLRLNYIKNIINGIKAMTAKAAIRGYAVDPSFEDFEIRNNDEPTRVYLTMNEITRLYYYQNLSRKKTRIRDLFVVGCLTGLRYSDYSNLTKDNFVGDYIIVLTKKTKKKVIVPIHDYVKEIYNKYKGSIPNGLSVQYFNRAIKQICKEVGINDDITTSYIKGGKIVTETKKKWEMVGSHTARRSLATNMHRTKRMSTSDIMQITGHTTENSFFKYVRVTNEEKAKNISSDMFFRI